MVSSRLLCPWERRAVTGRRDHHQGAAQCRGWRSVSFQVQRGGCEVLYDAFSMGMLLLDQPKLTFVQTPLDVFEILQF